MPQLTKEQQEWWDRMTEETIKAMRKEFPLPPKKPSPEENPTGK